MDKQHIINEIKRTANENGGKPLGTSRFFTETGIRQTDWYGKYWSKWGNALIEAGFSPNKMQGRYEDEFIIEKMIALIQELGKYPVIGEIRIKAKQDNTFPGHGTFSGARNKADLAKKIIEYCETREGFDDIVEICKPIAEDSKQESPVSEKQTTDGYVYLMKSGRDYKIGKSNSPGRREYELGTKMPNKPQLVHTIRTDDPTGIEKYWQNRFKDKHKNGEWFALTGDDIKAFKRRKFM